MLKDSMYEDVDASWADVNNDGNTDLMVALAAMNIMERISIYYPRVYLNDGKANFKKLENAFIMNISLHPVLLPNDFNGDGYIDLFLGGRAMPWNYGEIPRSYLLQNDGTGKFIDVTDNICKRIGQHWNGNQRSLV